jgi:hypothetical protein
VEAPGRGWPARQRLGHDRPHEGQDRSIGERTAQVVVATSAADLVRPAAASARAGGARRGASHRQRVRRSRAGLGGARSPAHRTRSGWGARLATTESHGKRDRRHGRVRRQCPRGRVSTTVGAMGCRLVARHGFGTSAFGISPSRARSRSDRGAAAGERGSASRNGCIGSPQRHHRGRLPVGGAGAQRARTPRGRTAGDRERGAAAHRP